ncbi:hypothetical protein RRF57_000720 [Xylaria bambusicola]|uniref:Uncharacterized protein n=1 Tax=Xylaria bambusicola TaxID=326684 RepID=A0AAN7UF29_9PEZI
MPKNSVTKPIPKGTPATTQLAQWIDADEVQANQNSPIGISHARMIRWGSRASGTWPPSFWT